MKYLSTLILAALLISCAQDKSNSTTEPPANNQPNVDPSNDSTPLNAGIHAIDSFHNLLVFENGESIVLPKKLQATATLDFKFANGEKWIDVTTSLYESLKYTCLSLTQELDPLALILRKNTPIIEGRSAHEYTNARSVFTRIVENSTRWRLLKMNIQFESNEYALQLLIAHKMHQKVKGVRALGMEDLLSFHDLISYGKESLMASYHPLYTETYTNLEYMNDLAMCDLIFDRMILRLKKDSHTVPIELKILGQ